MEFVPIRFLDDLFLNHSFVPELLGFRNARVWTQLAKEHLKNQFRVVVTISDEFHWKIERFNQFTDNQLHDNVPPEVYCTMILVKLSSAKRVPAQTDSAFKYFASVVKKFQIYVTVDSSIARDAKLFFNMDQWTISQLLVSCTLEGDGEALLDVMIRNESIASDKCQTVNKKYFGFIVQLLHRGAYVYCNCLQLLDLFEFWGANPKNLCRNKSCWIDESKITQVERRFLNKLYRKVQYKHEERGRSAKLKKVITFMHSTKKYEMVWTYRMQCDSIEVRFN